MAWKYDIECRARSRLWVECATEQGGAAFLSLPCSISDAGRGGDTGDQTAASRSCGGSGGGSATDCTALHSAEAEGLSSALVGGDGDCGLVEVTVTTGAPRLVPVSGELRQPSLSGLPD